MIIACRLVVAISLIIAALAGPPTLAAQIGDDEPDRILIADPSPALRTYLFSSGFRVESSEHLEALGLSLMTVLPPRRMPIAAALHVLQARFPAAIVAPDDPFLLAQDTRVRQGQMTQARQVFTAIGWQADGDYGAGLRIGVIDSTLDAAHPALRDAAIVQRSFTSGKPSTIDTAHGTAIAAMLVGRADDRAVTGLLRGATLYHANIFQKSRQGPRASSGDFLRAVDWLLRSGVTIINASITSPTYNAVVAYAMSLLSHGKGLVIAAAGNRGPAGPPVYPAAIETALAVTAVSIDGEAYPSANTGKYVDIAAPGIDLPTVSRSVSSGTSLAVPFVTAAVARIVQVCRVLPKQAQRILQAEARDLGARGWDKQFGWGLLQSPRCGPTQLTEVVR